MSTLPFTLRMPTNRAENAGGTNLNTGIQHVAVSVIHDPTMTLRGECRPDYTYDLRFRPVIALREWDEQVFLHELLHAATMQSAWWMDPQRQIDDPEGHDVISRIEVALWETGWRFRPTDEEAGS